MMTTDFIPLADDETVRYGRIVKRRRSPLMLAWVMLGALTAIFLCSSVIPKLTIIADEDGNWERVEIDWTRNMLGW